MSEKKNVLKDKSFGFAIRIINLYEYLTATKNEYVLSKQKNVMNLFTGLSFCFRQIIYHPQNMKTSIMKL